MRDETGYAMEGKRYSFRGFESHYLVFQYRAVAKLAYALVSKTSSWGFESSAPDQRVAKVTLR